MGRSFWIVQVDPMESQGPHKREVGKIWHRQKRRRPRDIRGRAWSNAATHELRMANCLQKLQGQQQTLPETLEGVQFHRQLDFSLE